MTCLDFDVHGEKLHLGRDGFGKWRPRLHGVASFMVAQIHDGVTEMDAVALLVAIFQQGVELTADGGGRDLDVQSRQTSDEHG